MLVLTRKIDQRIIIGDDIRITVVNVNPRSGEVRIGIEAPNDVLILREELSEEDYDE